MKKVQWPIPDLLLPDLVGNATDLTCATCSPQPTYASPDDTIGHVKVRKSDGVLCSNAVALTGLQQCQGQCGASDDTCSCCRPTVTTRRHVPLRCDDGSSMKHSYVVVHACQCGACGGEWWRGREPASASSARPADHPSSKNHLMTWRMCLIMKC